MKLVKSYTIFIVLICFWLTGSKVCAAESTDMSGRILFISSYSFAWDQVQLQIEGIKAGLSGNYTVDYEFMDTKRVDTEKAMELFKGGLAYRLSMVEPYDAVIIGDDAALLFAMENQEELFPETPIIFEGVNSEELAKTAIKNSYITGVLEKLSVESNVELGLRINPKATKVVAILDDSLTGITERKRFYKAQESFPELEFSEINASELSTTMLKKALSNVSKDTILIYVVMTEDANGKQYTNVETIRLLNIYADVPVIRMVEGGIGEGLLGGNIASMRKSGEMAAQLAIEAIQGVKRVGLNKLLDSPNIYCVDANIMKKFHLDFDALPEGTDIINYEESFWVRNRETLVPGIILFGALVIIIVVVGVDNIRRRKLVQELEKTKKIIETASQHDFLTGIPNRSQFMADLKQLIAQKIPCTVLMVDIDNFKKINDTMGHAAGDDALRQIAERMKDIESPILTPYRFAGDEFIMILKSSQSKIVEKTAYQCRQLFEKDFLLDKKKTKVGGSIGIASYPQDTEDLEQLIIFADDAMYQVKKNGKNDFAFYSQRKSG